MMIAGRWPIHHDSETIVPTYLLLYLSIKCELISIKIGRIVPE